jgi:hypothetical protein
MRRALGAAIIAVAAFGTTAALSAPAFASDDPNQPQLITSDQLTPILECSEPAGEIHIRKGDDVDLKELNVVDGHFKGGKIKGEKIKGEKFEIIKDALGPEDDACGDEGEMKCLVKHKEGGRVVVHFRDEKGNLHKRVFSGKKKAQVFTKKDAHVIKWVGCDFRR